MTRLLKVKEVYETHYLLVDDEQFDDTMIPHYSERKDILSISDRLLTESQYIQYLNETKDPLFDGR